MVTDKHEIKEISEGCVDAGVRGSGQSVPSVAIRWAVHNTNTNVELASLSNVSRRWREIVAECVVETGSLDSNDKRTPAPLLPSGFTRLLLPSLIRYFCASHSNRRPPQLGEETERVDEEDNETYCVAWFHPDGIRSKRLPSQNPSPGISEERGQQGHDVCILYQWDGYSEAVDILKPFGYSRSFLGRVFEATQNKLVDYFGEPVSLSSTSTCIDPHTRYDGTKSPLVIRGAIVARPEGYCECLDEQEDDLPHYQSETWLKKESMRKAQLERAVLPKVLWNHHETCDEETIGRIGITRPFVQFLNSDSSHAVRLLTPKFEKPIFTPMTVFCVAIATEDGCFFSGLRKRFEMGHMYPTDCDIEINDERSPICLNAEYNDQGTIRSRDEIEETAIGDGRRYINPDFMMEPVLGSHRECLYQMDNEETDNDPLDNESDTECCDDAVRGQLGPGSWHCYVGIFDGCKSIIRIDGVQESTSFSSKISSSYKACLDGITIGSDHSFDLSLCFGQGSDGEGEGAISELAFFKGRMQTKDVVSLESYLMTKHGIPISGKSRDENVRDDYFSRLAHKLMDQSPSHANRKSGCGSKSTSVPLRYMTELRQVSWRRKSKVTGQPMTVQRIGNKFRTDSMSEW